MTVAVVNSGGANITSVTHALRRLGVEPVFTSVESEIRAAERVILPGVGSAGSAMASLRRANLLSVLRDLRQPVLGICLGMQLLFEVSEEDDTAMLGLLAGRVERLSGGKDIRVPHMGWNQVSYSKPENLNLHWFYFVHSYAAPVGEWTLATSNHGQPFSAVVGQDNYFGVQFHPERSAAGGAQLLRRFLEDGRPCN